MQQQAPQQRVAQPQQARPPQERGELEWVRRRSERVAAAPVVASAGWRQQAGWERVLLSPGRAPRRGALRSLQALWELAALDVALREPARPRALLQLVVEGQVQLVRECRPPASRDPPHVRAPNSSPPPRPALRRAPQLRRPVAPGAGDADEPR